MGELLTASQICFYNILSEEWHKEVGVSLLKVEECIALCRQHNYLPVAACNNNKKVTLKKCCVLA